jgi:hypothetical protein
VKPFHEAELHASVEMALYKHGHDRRSRSREQHVTDAITNHNHIQTMDARSFESF